MGTPIINGIMNANGTSISAKGSFCALSEGVLPPPGAAWSQLLNGWKQQVRASYTVTPNALSNVVGGWYERLLAISAWNYRLANPQALMAVPLPNVTQFEVMSLYLPALYQYIVDFRTKVLEFNVRLITSNPDFALINTSGMALPPSFSEPMTTVDLAALNTLETAYQVFVGQCDFQRIVGFMSAKTSLRPDRRLQIAHEGSLMKALYTHLQTRQWMLTAPGLRYYGVSTRVRPSDEVALSTVATPSIITVGTAPQRAVDAVLPVNSTSQAETVFAQILMP